jgi:hypothetical protein
MGPVDPMLDIEGHDLQRGRGRNRPAAGIYQGSQP